MKTLIKYYIFFFTLPLLFSSCSSNQNSTSRIFNFDEFHNSLNQNLQEADFDKIKETIKKQENVTLTDSQLSVLNKFTLRFIIKYKDKLVEDSRFKKDTIFNDFILNGTRTQFQKRLNKLQVGGDYKLGRLSTILGIFKGYCSQISDNKGSTKIVIRPLFKMNRLFSLELHSFEEVGQNPVNGKLISKYGSPIRGFDIGTSNLFRKSFYEWKGVSELIRENNFHPIKSFIMMGGQLSEDNFKNYDHIWFTDNFVVIEISSLLHSYETHYEFLRDYQNKIDKINSSKETTNNTNF